MFPIDSLKVGLRPSSEVGDVLTGQWNCVDSNAGAVDFSGCDVHGHVGCVHADILDGGYATIVARCCIGDHGSWTSSCCIFW
jgi:hypothetical protein